MYTFLQSKIEMDADQPYGTFNCEATAAGHVHVIRELLSVLTQVQWQQTGCYIFRALYSCVIASPLDTVGCGSDCELCSANLIFELELTKLQPRRNKQNIFRSHIT